MKSFGILTINNGRPKVLNLWCASVKRLREDLQMYIPAVVVSGAEDKSMCQKYFINHITQQNNPASRKWNTGVSYLMNQNLDYIIICGSDDIISTNLLKNILIETEKETDLIYLNIIYFYGGDGAFRGQLRRLTTKQILGVGRTISRRVIKATGTLWTRDRNWGMDGDCWKNISPHVQTKAVVEGVVVDVKTSENLNSMNFWMGKLKEECDPQVFYSILGNEEKEIIQGL
jgi:glycosyltransferase involved in cell wall biosynthesis